LCFSLLIRQHQQKQHGAEASAAQGWRWQRSGGDDGGGGSSAAVSSGETGLQGGSNGGGKAVAFICTSFAVYEFIFLSIFQ
jgi:hypothetical protein